MKEDKKLNPFIRFSGIGIQMFVTIYLGNYFGEWLDVKYHNDSGLYAKICTLVAVFAAMYLVISQAIKMSK